MLFETNFYFFVEDSPRRSISLAVFSHVKLAPPLPTQRKQNRWINTKIVINTWYLKVGNPCFSIDIFFPKIGLRYMYMYREYEHFVRVQNNNIMNAPKTDQVLLRKVEYRPVLLTPLSLREFPIVA